MLYFPRPHGSTSPRPALRSSGVEPRGMPIGQRDLGRHCRREDLPAKTDRPEGEIGIILARLWSEAVNKRAALGIEIVPPLLSISKTKPVEQPEHALT